MVKVLQEVAGEVIAAMPDAKKAQVQGGACGVAARPAWMLSAAGAIFEALGLG